MHKLQSRFFRRPFRPTQLRSSEKLSTFSPKLPSSPDPFGV
ncbi:hypothetical protein NEISICOT_01287 [Neisseria sicca ATCC 29256]|uniref:Uncharacterized protein n=1 Tax=Neisseria sicca ATCC 29256 TaxID=547045 RepID=C6M444_NEISI|nr:hypothetical protein NEISICOT_01287 [Neisseria sicca ATCC 29256]